MLCVAGRHSVLPHRRGTADGGRDLIERDVTKATERRAFIFLVVFFGPILAGGIVGGYGFLVWMSQLVFGLPGS